MRWKTEFFSPDPQIFFLPNRQENQLEKTASLLFYHKALPPTLMHALHLPHLKTFAHKSWLCPIQAHVNAQPILCKGVMFG